jgi:hypothetical protein
VAIAVAVAPGVIQEPADFSLLNQPSLELARAERTRGGAGPLDSPLGELLRSALYADGATRGMSVRKVQKHCLQLQSFRISPHARPRGPMP